MVCTEIDMDLGQDVLYHVAVLPDLIRFPDPQFEEGLKVEIEDPFPTNPTHHFHVLNNLLHDGQLVSRSAF